MLKVTLLNPPSRDGLIEIVAEGLYKLREKVDALSSNSVYWRADLGITHLACTSDVTLRLKSSDLILVGVRGGIAYWSDDRISHIKLLDEFNLWDKVAYLDGSDYGDHTEDPFYKKAKWYFKRERELSRQYTRTVYPLPYSLLDRYGKGSNSRKTLTYSVMIKEHSEQESDRSAFVKVAREVSEGYEPCLVGEVHGPESHTSDARSMFDYTGGRYSSNYYHTLDISRASVSLFAKRCCSYDTYRYWEILARGLVLISESTERKLVIPNPLVPGKHYVPVDTPEDLGRVLRCLQRDPSCYDHIAKGGYEYASRCHTSECRVRFLLNTCGYDIGV